MICPSHGVIWREDPMKIVDKYYDCLLYTSQVVPGDVLELECRLTARRGPVGFGQAEAKVNGRLACRAEISFAINSEKAEPLR